jgi:hypothetical protein
MMFRLQEKGLKSFVLKSSLTSLDPGASCGTGKWSLPIRDLSESLGIPHWKNLGKLCVPVVLVRLPKCDDCDEAFGGHEDVEKEHWPQRHGHCWAEVSEEGWLQDVGHAGCHLQPINQQRRNFGE